MGYLTTRVVAFSFPRCSGKWPHSPGWIGSKLKAGRYPNGEFPANYAGWAGNRALPVFNHDNPEVRDIMEIAEYWIKFGIDGWRLDVPFEVRPRF